MAIALAALLVIVAVGLSRLYLGVHFLSDVLGGDLIGLAFVFYIAFALHYAPPLAAAHAPPRGLPAAECGWSAGEAGGCRTNPADDIPTWSRPRPTPRRGAWVQPPDAAAGAAVAYAFHQSWNISRV